jgi:uncharacterized membrane protein YGL010W
MLGNRSWPEWVADYQKSHENRWNQLTHTFGIPMIIPGIFLALVSVLGAPLWAPAIWLSVLGWVLQFIGHAIEGKPPEFLSDWRFRLVGPRWWWAKVTGNL